MLNKPMANRTFFIGTSPRQAQFSDQQGRSNRAA